MILSIFSKKNKTTNKFSQPERNWFPPSSIAKARGKIKMLKISPLGYRLAEPVA